MTVKSWGVKLLLTNWTSCAASAVTSFAATTAPSVAEGFVAFTGHRWRLTASSFSPPLL